MKFKMCPSKTIRKPFHFQFFTKITANYCHKISVLLKAPSYILWKSYIKLTLTLSLSPLSFFSLISLFTRIYPHKYRILTNLYTFCIASVSKGAYILQPRCPVNLRAPLLIPNRYTNCKRGPIKSGTKPVLAPGTSGAKPMSQTTRTPLGYKYRCISSIHWHYACVHNLVKQMA